MAVKRGMAVRSPRRCPKTRQIAYYLGSDLANMAARRPRTLIFHE
jgi:hypothetical protein